MAAPLKIRADARGLAQSIWNEGERGSNERTPKGNRTVYWFGCHQRHHFTYRNALERCKRHPKANLQILPGDGYEQSCAGRGLYVSTAYGREYPYKHPKPLMLCPAKRCGSQ